VIAQAAPAKLNLTLSVVGRRADGYHLLDSVVAFTEFGDTVGAAAGDGLSLALDGPFAPGLKADGAENLVLRAARLLADAAGIRADAALTLTKRLPVASGIGGGSSDAAAALRALSELWRLNLSDEEMHSLALRLGADVPVCLSARPARLEGIGERVTPLPDFPSAPLVLVNPGIALATQRVFAARTGAFSAGTGILTAPAATPAALADALRPAGNDLTEAAIGLVPEIGDVLAALGRAPACLLARMSGSGATCFGLFATDQAAAAAATIAKAAPRWWVAATRLRGAAASP
jgi:4-diphosphocytidyl-2-C-methyl-D-erythritol kinase